MWPSNADSRSSIYSLGVMAFSLMSGEDSHPVDAAKDRWSGQSAFSFRQAKCPCRRFKKNGISRKSLSKKNLLTYSGMLEI
jgi:hypothetical protein